MSLRFRIAPHLVEDLGLNLYTDLARALVEFIANAYDADSPHVRVSVPFAEITKARRLMRAEHKHRAEVQRVSGGTPPPALAQMTLPDDLVITVEDEGHGMTREDLEEKFLFTGRRRRGSDAGDNRSPGGRLVMGRKGVGKLAGFGIAHSIRVTSRKKGESHATQIDLDYDEIRRAASMDEVRVPDMRLEDGGGIDPHGTRIELKRLQFEPLGKRESTLENAIAEHFFAIDPKEFEILLGSKPLEPKDWEHRFAWPGDPTAIEGLHPVELPVVDEDGNEVDKITFKYRLRFTKEPLAARERGVRVYAHHRLASAPDLLDTPTGMHGFRNTDYLQGVVHADFIDDQPLDYIATDRQSLRWDAPLLRPMREFLSSEMKKACAAFQRTRDETFRVQVRKDPYTKDIVQKARLSTQRAKQAYRIAAVLADFAPRGLNDTQYKEQVKTLVGGLGTGDTVRALEQLAESNTPQLEALLAEAMRLTHREHEELLTFMEGRVGAIITLSRIVREVDFAAAKREKEVQELLKRAPWLLDPHFSNYVSADEQIDTTFERLAKELTIDSYASEDRADETRADLVFLLAPPHGHNLLIVELKAPNVKLNIDHLAQLERYMRKATDFLEQYGKNVGVRGMLIGSKDLSSKSDKVQDLRHRIEREMDKADWSVYDFGEVLRQTRQAHEELMTVYRRLTEEGGEEELEDEDRPAAIEAMTTGSNEAAAEADPVRDDALSPSGST